MKGNGIIKYNIADEKAVSEAVGAILMVSLAVIGVAIVSVIILGQSTPTEIPSLSMIPDTTDTDLLLYHSGGDSLNRGEFFVRVDGMDYYPDEISLIDQGGDIDTAWDSWDVGEVLDITGESDYKQVQIISTKGGQESLISGSGEAIIPYTPTGTPTTTVTPTPTTTVTPTPGAPVAAFIGSPLSGASPLSVTFTDLSTGIPTSWLWDFGDGGTSTLQNPVHSYASVGTYTVSLKATNAYGFDYENKTSYISVGAAPVADFTANVTSGIAPLTVNFTDLSTGSPTLWSWDFGDGGTSNGQNPVHIYNLAGIYNVTLLASNGYGNDTEVKTGYITVTELPQPAAWWKFDEASGTTVLDSSGNNNNGVISGSYSRPAGACNSALYFDGTGTYVTVPDSNTLDAPNYITYAAWLMPEPPVSPYIDNYTSLIDKGLNDVDNYEFFISRLGSTSEFTFETYSGGGLLEYTTNNFDYGYGEWQHVAFVADTDAGTAKLFIDGEYAALLTSSLPSSFTTNSNALTMGMQQYESYTFHYKGMMDEVMLFTTALTDDQIRTIYDTCTPPPRPIADFSASPVSGVLPLSVTFTDLSTGSPDSWLWNFGDGGTSTSQNPVHVYGSGGIYDVTLTVSNAGGYSVKTVENMITVSSPIPPVADFIGSPLSGTSPLSVTFTDLSTGSPTSWLWDFGDGGTSTLQNPVYVYSASGRYTVSLTVSNAYGNDIETKNRYIRVR